ncbi:MAG: hypothetical protein JRC58_08735 [Deltaproteobacteria bacterium]|nr:hypothetical protein [Deltaproteobacteria bacterium]
MRRDSSRSNNAGLNVRWLVTFVVITAITMFSLSVNIEAGENDFPFNPGEKLTFQLKWTFIPAGEGVLEVLPLETIDGVKAYHFLLTVKSNSFIDHCSSHFHTGITLIFFFLN